MPQLGQTYFSSDGTYPRSQLGQLIDLGATGTSTSFTTSRVTSRVCVRPPPKKTTLPSPPKPPLEEDELLFTRAREEQFVFFEWRLGRAW